MNPNQESLYCKYQSLISEGEYLLNILSENHRDIDGINKLQHKIKMDNICLNQALLHNNMKKEHIACTNLTFYKGLVEEIISQQDADAVLETLSYKTSDNCQMRLTVDIVSEKGGKWTKIIARNPLALQHIYKDGDGFGRRSILDQARSYIQAANQNLHLFSPPQVVFSFVNGVPEKMKLYLQQIGITIKGKVLPLDKVSTHTFIDSDGDDSDVSLICESLPLFPNKQESSNKLNLCVTTMIAYVSSLTNGGHDKTFLEPLLNQQAEMERFRPVKPHLSHLFEGKSLIACSTVIDDFTKIINNIGGEEETVRAQTLLARVEVVPDVSFSGLKLSGQIKKRSLVIFGTGHHHCAITVSANKGFVCASKQKGVKFAVILHESRALTERKELK